MNRLILERYEAREARRPSSCGCITVSFEKRFGRTCADFELRKKILADAVSEPDS